MKIETPTILVEGEEQFSDTGERRQVSQINWSETEKKAAREAFDRAYEREITALMAQVREKASEISHIDQLWQLHDFLSAKRHEIEGKYDCRYSVLVFVLAQLVKEGWLQSQELSALQPDKRAKIAALARF